MSANFSPSEILLLEKIVSAKKYQFIATDFILRIGKEELEKRKTFSEALKETKKRLHQVAASYRLNPLSNQDLEILQKAKDSSNSESIKNCCKSILGKHSSTAERLPILDSFYSTLFISLPPINTILDVACGLNPLTIPWIPSEHRFTYLAWDIYADIIRFINQALCILEVPGKAELVDILGKHELPAVDLTLILKSLPCLEQIQKNFAIELLMKIRSRFTIISFPSRSLSGKEKGMLQNYSRVFSKWIMEVRDSGLIIKEKYEFQNEIAFLLERNPQ